MLPFLANNRKQQAGVIIQERKPDEKPNDSEDMSGIEACAQDLMDAMKSSDVKKAAAALRAAFELCDMEPHEEGPHTFEAQNKKAGEQE